MLSCSWKEGDEGREGGRKRNEQSWVHSRKGKDEQSEYEARRAFFFLLALSGTCENDGERGEDDSHAGFAHLLRHHATASWVDASRGNLTQMHLETDAQLCVSFFSFSRSHLVSPTKKPFLFPCFLILYAWCGRCQVFCRDPHKLDLALLASSRLVWPPLPLVSSFSSLCDRTSRNSSSFFYLFFPFFLYAWIATG